MLKVITVISAAFDLGWSQCFGLNLYSSKPKYFPLFSRHFQNFSKIWNKYKTRIFPSEPLSVSFFHFDSSFRSLVCISDVRCCYELVMNLLCNTDKHSCLQHWHKMRRREIQTMFSIRVMMMLVTLVTFALHYSSSLFMQCLSKLLLIKWHRKDLRIGNFLSCFLRIFCATRANAGPNKTQNQTNLLEMSASWDTDPLLSCLSSNLSQNRDISLTLCYVVTILLLMLCYVVLCFSVFMFSISLF